MKQYEKFLMQQNEVYTLYKNYTSDIMQALKEKIDENKKLKEKININEKEIDSLKNQIIIKDKEIDNQYKKIKELEQKVQDLKSKSIIEMEEYEEDIFDEIQLAYLKNDNELLDNLINEIIDIDSLKIEKNKIISLLYIGFFRERLEELLYLNEEIWSYYIDNNNEEAYLLKLLQKELNSDEIRKETVQNYISKNKHLFLYLDEELKDKIISDIKSLTYKSFLEVYPDNLIEKNDKCEDIKAWIKMEYMKYWYLVSGKYSSSTGRFYMPNNSSIFQVCDIEKLNAYDDVKEEIRDRIKNKISKIEEGFKGISLNKIKKAKDKLYSFNEKEDLLDFLTNYKLSDDLIDEKQVNSLLFISLFYGILTDVLKLSPYLKEYINVKKDILVLLRLMYSEKKVKSNEMVSIPVKKFISHKGSILSELDDVIRDKVITLIKEMYKCYSDYAVMYNKGINKCPNDNFEVKNREIFIKVKKDNKVKYICTDVNACIKCNLPYINNKEMRKLSNYLNEYSFVVKELQIEVEDVKEKIKNKKVKAYEKVISSFKSSERLEALRNLNKLLNAEGIIKKLDKNQITTLLFISYYLKGRDYIPNCLLEKITFTDVDYEKHIYDKLINLNDFRNYLDIYKNKLILIDERVKDKIIWELEQSALRISKQKKNTINISVSDLGNNLNEESELKKLGYSSSLSRVERWNILKNKAIPKLGKVKVESHIRWLIKMNINRSNRSNAVNEWQYDLEKLSKIK